ncbi:MAG TPA: AAA family ATPase [Myxococcota bacterium]|nr:AAA family ATPase [Myxococcota bacterium]
MNVDPIERKLAAVLSADAVGYSRLMADDDAATVRDITARRERIASIIQLHRGRLVDSPGDNLLAEFGSALNAVRCAIEVQRSLDRINARVAQRRRMEFRIGVHVGDVVVEGDRIYGDGVNLAARLERLARPGEICISSHVHDLVARKLRVAQEDLGELRLHNYPEAVRVYRLLATRRPPQPDEASSAPETALALAVLPFDALSGSDSERHFGDGLVEDLTTRLAGIPHLAVIARTTSFARRGRPVDLRRLGRELGARFVVEGSVRCADDRVRASVQLIDARSGLHVWAQNFDHPAGESLRTQDELTARIVAAMRPVLAPALETPRDLPIEPALLGRTEERARIRGLLQRGFAGRGCIVLVSGEAGVGKSRLAEEALLDAEEQGALALVGRCHRGDGAPAYWPWIEILRELSRNPDAAAMVAAHRSHERALDLLLSEAPAADAEDLAAPVVDAAGQFRLFAATTRVLIECARRHPLVLLLEDLQEADPASLRLLEFVAGQLRGAPLSILVTHRPQDDADAPLAATLGALSRESRTERLELSGLSREDSETLVARVAKSLDPESIRTICGQCDGNPLYLNEIARHAEVTGSARPLQIPSTVREAIQARLRAQRPRLLELLIAASVASPRLESGLLADVAEIPLDEADSLLEEAARARIVRATEEPGVYRFAHPLVLESIYSGVAAAERIRLHARVAQALERRLGAGAGPHAAELAHHLAAGVPVVDWRHALDLSLCAGRAACERFAWEEAAEHYERAAALGQRDPDPDPRRRCEILLAMAEAQYRAGARQRTFDAFREVASLAREGGDAKSLARAALGLWGPGVPFGDDVLRGEPMLEEALVALGSDSGPVTARVLARLASAPSRTPAQARLALSRAERALAIARATPDPDTLAIALLGLRTALEGPAELERRSACDLELVSLGRDARNLEIELQGHYGLLVDALERGDAAALKREASAHELLATELHQPFHLWRAARVRAMRALLVGDLTGAEQHAQEALRVGQRSADVDSLLNYGVQIFRVRWAQGRLVELEGQILALVARRPSALTPRAGLCLLLCETGRSEQARPLFDRLMAECADEPPRDPEWTTALVSLVEVAARLGAEKHAERLHLWLEPYGRVNVIVGATCCFGPGSYYLGLTAATLGRWDEAALRFESALAMAGALDAKEITARVLLEFGRRAAARSDTDQRRLGRKLLGSARALAAELGMDAVARAALLRAPTSRIEVSGEGKPKKEQS